MKSLILKTVLVLVVLTAAMQGARAQFREQAFNQTYNNQSDSTAARDSVDKMWSFREFFRGVSHKDTTMRIGTMFGGSTVFIGAEQIHNRQYWKLPVIYGGLGATVGLGVHYRHQYNTSLDAYNTAVALDPDTELTVDTHSKDMSNYMFAGAALIYWGTLMDGVVNFKRDVKHQPGKATIYSILMPGLGQAYNGEYWKIPVYWGMIVGSCHYYATFNKSYKRFKRIHNEATSPDVEYKGTITAERALYFRNLYRRYRDYSVVAIAGSYLVQIIDANVFAYMQDFEVNDDLTMRVAPTVITPDADCLPFNEYAVTTSSRTVPGMSFGQGAFGDRAIGLKVGFTF